MGLFTKKNNNELSGRNIFIDKKNRTVYFSPITKTAYILKPVHYDTFRRLSTRFILPVLSFLLMSGVIFDKPILNIPHPIIISLVVSAIIYLVLAYRFYKKFLPTLTTLPSFTPGRKLSMLDKARSTEVSKSALKTVLLIALAVLFVLNGQQMYEKNPQELTLYLNYALAVGSAILGLFQLFALLTRNKSKSEIQQ